MKHLSLRVIAESPVAIRSDQTASGAARAKYIPGSTVVGGLTTLYRQSDIPPYHRIAAQSESYTRLQTHTGIHRESGTVQDGILYNRQVYEEGMQFWGEILFPDDEQLFLPFAEFLHEIGHTGLLRLGLFLFSLALRTNLPEKRIV